MSTIQFDPIYQTPRKDKAEIDTKEPLYDPLEEALRLEAVHRLLILDTPPEETCDEITSLAASIFPTCNAMLTFIDETRVWVKAKSGNAENVLPRHLSLCSLVIQQDKCIFMLDTRTDPRLTDGPYLCKTEGPRFYAGAPLITHDGQRVGVLCIVDSKPWKSFGIEEQEKLMTLASLAADRLELRSLQQEALASENPFNEVRSLGEHVLSLVPGTQPALRARTRLRNELDFGIQQGQMELHYQPEIDLNSQVIAGFEALVRWKHPTRGLLAPGDFIPLAEETGLVTFLGDWCLREACRQAVAWRAVAAERLDLRVSVNLSATQFENVGLFENVTQLLGETGLYPEELRLELTETSLMSSADIVLVTMKRLRDIGVGLHMDDFGTGYSSLHTLHRFPFDTIKIDRSFITKLDYDESALQIVQTITNLCKILKMEVVAEGIETERQADILRSIGCDYGQGYFFSHPLRCSEVMGLLEQQIGGMLTAEHIHFGSNPHYGLPLPGIA